MRNGTFEVDCSIAVVCFRFDWLQEVDHLRLRKSLDKYWALPDKYDNIVTVKEKLSVNLIKFRKIVIDGNLKHLPETQQSGCNSC